MNDNNSINKSDVITRNMILSRMLLERNINEESSNRIMRLRISRLCYILGESHKISSRNFEIINKITIVLRFIQNISHSLKYIVYFPLFYTLINLLHLWQMNYSPLPNSMIQLG